MSNDAPSPRQLDMLRAIFGYLEGHDGIAPSRRDLGALLGVTQNAVSDQLKALVRKGCVVLGAPKHSRSLVLTRKGLLAIGVGHVARERAEARLLAQAKRYVRTKAPADRDELFRLGAELEG